jgi:hypothetical protein
MFNFGSENVSCFSFTHSSLRGHTHVAKERRNVLLLARFVRTALTTPPSHRLLNRRFLPTPPSFILLFSRSSNNAPAEGSISSRLFRKHGTFAIQNTWQSDPPPPSARLIFMGCTVCSTLTAPTQAKKVWQATVFPRD